MDLLCIQIFFFRMWSQCTDCTHAWLRFDHNMSQTTSRCGLADPITFPSQCMLHALTCVFPYPDRVSRYRSHANARYKWSQKLFGSLDTTWSKWANMFFAIWVKWPFVKCTEWGNICTKMLLGVNVLLPFVSIKKHYTYIEIQYASEKQCKADSQKHAHSWKQVRRRSKQMHGHTNTYRASHDGGKNKAPSQYKGVNSGCDCVGTSTIVCCLL